MEVGEQEIDVLEVGLKVAKPVRIGSKEPASDVRVWEARVDEQDEVGGGADFRLTTRTIFRLLVEAARNRLVKEVAVVGVGLGEVVFESEVFVGLIAPGHFRDDGGRSIGVRGADRDLLAFEVGQHHPAPVDATLFRRAEGVAAPADKGAFAVGMRRVREAIHRVGFVVVLRVEAQSYPDLPHIREADGGAPLLPRLLEDRKEEGGKE